MEEQLEGEKPLTTEEWSETEEGKWLKISLAVSEMQENHKTRRTSDR